MDRGEWTPERMAEALEQFEATKRAVDESRQDPPPLEPDVVDAVMQCIGWMPARAGPAGPRRHRLPLLTPGAAHSFARVGESCGTVGACRHHRTGCPCTAY
ncbi:DUF7691 family protein [Streptomyces toyocaensis]|uniref:DUF7691 family protein n=1 Tax=Streptomyces toyocaensis TaxID=55952 RepID=UPI003F4CEB49